ncbi:MAG: glycosyl hydrolase, partial [Planctomycetota bacterium]
FGRAVPGIFTDEPKYFEGSPGGADLPWTPRLPEVFRKRYGYDLLERLPELFFEVAGADSHALRRDYYDCITHLFVDAFTKAYAERCSALGLDMTGHYLEEQTLASQTRVIGAAMRHYEHMRSPGIDILRESISEVLTVKQCSSVARQFGRKRVLSELYGASGWDFTFEGEKWVGDWQIALGVSLRCQHLSWYTMARSGKRDYPPCFNYQSSSWKYHKATEDYFARLCLMTTRGEADREVLVLHPIESYWSERAALAPQKSDLEGSLDDRLVTVMTALLENHHDFDLGDEDILARHASVEAKSLRVGKTRYHAVVVPPAVTWRRSTVDLLERFADAGGKVVGVGPAAERVDCEKGRRFAGIHSREDVRTVECDKAEIAEALEAARVRTVSVADAGGDEVAPILVQRRSHEGHTILFLANTDRKRAHAADIALCRTTGGVEDWDLRTGEVRPVPSRELDGWVYTSVELPPSGSKMLVVGPGLDATVPPGRKLKDAGKVRLGRTWKHERAEPNARVLDKCRWRLDDGALSEETAVWAVDAEVRRMINLPSVESYEKQPYGSSWSGRATSRSR